MENERSSVDVTDAISKVLEGPAGAIVREMSRVTRERGGQVAELLILTEEVVAMIVLISAMPNYENEILDRLVVGAKERLAKMRLVNLDTQGTA
jgi:hypothetical protein